MGTEKEMVKTLYQHYVPSAEFYSQVIDSLQDYSIFTVDSDLNVNSWNSGAEKIFQYATHEIIGKPFEIIFTKEDRESDIPKQEIDIALKVGRSTDIRWHLCKDGTTFYADGLVFPLIDHDKLVIGYVKILRDITSRKTSEDAIKKYARELKELNTHKENMLAILSHDLRSPLATIIQGVEYLESNLETTEPEFVKKMLHELHNAAVNELNMLDYLVEWARIKYAADAFVPTRIKLVDYVEKVFKSLKDTAALKAIEFHSSIDPNLTVFADGKMLISILQNLVSNAIKHSFKGGQITLSACKNKEMVVVEIKDTGAGMSRETRDKLFTPQIDSLSKAVDGNNGAGIGLLLVKGFLEKNGGAVWVESTERKGSSFFFSLPINQPLDEVNVLKDVEE